MIYAQKSFEEILDIKNFEIKCLNNKLELKEQKIRELTIRYDNYLSYYESRWGKYINEFNYVEHELYRSKSDYYKLLEQLYEDSERNDSKIAEELAKTKKELNELKESLSKSIPLEDIRKIVRNLPITQQKESVLQLQWLLSGTNFDKISNKLIEEVRNALAQYEQEIRKNLNGDNYNDSPIFSFIIDQANANNILTLLNMKISSANNKDSQAFPIRAAINAGVIKRIPYNDFKEAFPYATISQTRYNAIINIDNEDKAVTFNKIIIEQLELLFKKKIE